MADPARRSGFLKRVLRCFVPSSFGSVGARDKPALLRAKVLDRMIMENNIDEACRLLDCMDEDELYAYADNQGNTLLHIAAFKRSIFLRVFLLRGCSIHAINRGGRTPLHEYCGTTSVSPTVVYTPNQGMVLNDPILRDLTSNFASHRPKLKDYDGLIALIEAGSNPNAQDKSGSTPMVLAILANCEPRILCLLMRHGANPFVTDNAGRDAFAWSAMLGMLRCHKILRIVCITKILVTARMYPEKTGERQLVHLLSLDLIRHLILFLL